MFVAETEVFTDSGWKKISDIAHRDRVLTRNFIGDAEFIQPFALTKKKYSGDVITIGGKDFSFTVTPDHKDIDAKKIERKFRYMFSDDVKKEYIYIDDEFGKRTTTIEHLDWYKLVAYVLMRSFVNTSRKRPMLYLLLSIENYEHEIAELVDIFDRIGIHYHIQYPKDGGPRFVVSSRNSLVARLKYRLGSTTRREMFLPDKMIYNSTREHAQTLIETIIALCNGQTQISTTNTALIDSLVLFGTINGYSVRSVLKSKAGTPTLNGQTHRDNYIIQISGQTALYSVKKRKKSTYSGYVYGIDLFEGKVLVKEGKYPVWTAPK